MALIDTEEAAQRLARVIASDIELYGREKIRAGEALTREIDEGYALFRSRVVPGLVPLLEVALADKGLTRGKGAPAAAARRPEPDAPAAPAPPTPAPARAQAPAHAPTPTPTPPLASAPTAAARSASAGRTGPIDTEEGA